MTSAEYVVALHGSEASVQDTFVLTDEQASFLQGVGAALDQQNIPYAPSMAVTKAPAYNHSDVIALLRNERDQVTPKNSQNPRYHAYSRAISALKELDAGT